MNTYQNLVEVPVEPMQDAQVCLPFDPTALIVGTGVTIAAAIAVLRKAARSGKVGLWLFRKLFPKQAEATQVDEYIEQVIFYMEEVLPPDSVLSRQTLKENMLSDPRALASMVAETNHEYITVRNMSSVIKL